MENVKPKDLCIYFLGLLLAVVTIMGAWGLRSVGSIQTDVYEIRNIMEAPAIDVDE